MHDPFPLPASPLLQRLTQQYLSPLGLTTLHLHIHEIIYAFTLYQFIFAYLAPTISKNVFPKYYLALSRENRLNWCMKWVSFVQATLISALSLWVMYHDKERAAMGFEQRIWGYTGAAGLVQAFAVGYFLWDSYIMVRYTKIFGVAMLVHGFGATAIYGFGFRPVLNYYGCVFMLYELSTPFVNIHWTLDKIGMTGSRLQIYNGVVLILVFFGARLVWGGYMSVQLYSDIWKAMQLDCRSVDKLIGGGVSSAGNCPLPRGVIFIELACHVALNSLNVYWFRAMIRAIRRRADYKPKDY